MDKRAALLVVLILLSAITIIESRHQSRVAFAHLQSLKTERDELNIEWGKLLLEEGAWSQHHRVETIAHARLDMGLPAVNEVWVLDLRNAEVVR
jgi:cell division protein FtsL